METPEKNVDIKIFLKITWFIVFDLLDDWIQLNVQVDSKFLDDCGEAFFHWKIEN